MEAFETVKSLLSKVLDKLKKFDESHPRLSKVTTIAAVNVILLISRKVWIKKYRYFKKYPPGPTGLPLIGCGLSFGSDPWAFSRDIGCKYKPMASVPLLFGQTTIFINDYDLIFKLSKEKAFLNRPVLMSYLSDFESNFLGINGEEWLKRRKLFHNTLLRITDSKFLSKYVLNNVNNTILVPSIEDAIKNNNGIWDPKKSTVCYAFNTIFTASFGNKNMKVYDWDNKEYNKFLLKSKEWFDSGLLLLALATWNDKLYKYLFDMYVKPHYSELHRLMHKWIDETRKDNSDGDDDIGQDKDKDKDRFVSYVDSMLKADFLSKEKAISDILASFSGGTNTTSDSIQVLLLAAVKYPKTQELIYKQLCNVFKENNATTDTITLKMLQHGYYLRAFIETCFKMRSLGGLPRELKKDIKIDFYNKQSKKNDFYILAKGSAILFNVHGCSMFDKNYTNINDGVDNVDNDDGLLDISEYLDSNGKFFKPHNVSIFGYGLRNCPGQSLARKEIMFALAVLFYKYKFYGPKGKNDRDVDYSKIGLPGGGSTPTLIGVERRYCELGI